MSARAAVDRVEELVGGALVPGVVAHVVFGLELLLLEALELAVVVDGRDHAPEQQQQHAEQEHEQHHRENNPQRVERARAVCAQRRTTSACQVLCALCLASV